MLGQNALCPETHLSFLPPCVYFLPPGTINLIVPHFILSARIFLTSGVLSRRQPGWRRRGERHAQIGTNNVDDGLAVCGVVLSEPFECAQPVPPDLGATAAELPDGLGVEAGEAHAGLVGSRSGQDVLLLVATAEGNDPRPGRPPWPGALMRPPAMGRPHEVIIS